MLFLYLFILCRFFFSQLVTQLSLNTWLQEFFHRPMAKYVCACAWMCVREGKRKRHEIKMLRSFYVYVLLPKLALVIEFVENKQSRFRVKSPIALFSRSGLVCWFYTPGNGVKLGCFLVNSVLLTQMSVSLYFYNVCWSFYLFIFR